MIRVIEIDRKPKTQVPQGALTMVLDPPLDGTRVSVSLAEVEPGNSFRLTANDRTQVVYILEGTDADITHTVKGASSRHIGQRRSGVYLEPGDEATVTAVSVALTLLLVTVPKHTSKPGAAASPEGYFFVEAELPSLIDETRLRERTFWVNKETGLSKSWDMQLGRMSYGPRAHSPRHVHRPSKTSPISPEHFYLIEKGTGEVKHDSGTVAVGPGSLVLIPAGEWHQLVASDTGFDYIEFQAPFDFTTTMDHDPLGKNWYMKGTDDGTGKPKLWLQS